MKKILVTLLCLFLSVVIIGACVFPGVSFTSVVPMIVKNFVPLRTAVDFVVGAVSALFPQNDIIIESTRDYVLNNSEKIVNMFRTYIPYHLEKYDLYDRCSDQGFFNLFVEKSSFHEEHKICRLCCLMNYRDQETPAQFVVGYCAICNELVFCYYVTDMYIFSTVRETFDLYPGANTFEGIAGALFYANTFKWYEMDEYINSLNL